MKAGKTSNVERRTSNARKPEVWRDLTDDERPAYGDRRVKVIQNYYPSDNPEIWQRRVLGLDCSQLSTNNSQLAQ
jgi:hypothetical protein